MRKPLKI